jgi:IclR family transcriptional regulator, mhp operon transcriptional activator
MVTRLENRSLDRALSILEVLARDAPCSLHQLHERSGLPKSTIRRLLGTLSKRHFIRQGISDGLYRTNISLPWAGDREHAATAARLVEVARPHMIRLTATIKWSSNLGIPRAGRWHLIESTRSISPFNIDRLKILDHERNSFATASGLAYLSALDDVQVLEIVRALQGDLQWGLEYVKIDESTLLRELKDIRAKGYAIRRKGFQARPESRRYNAIAVAINDGRHAIGSINLWWPRRHLSAERFARAHLAALQATADAISADLARFPSA